MDTGVFRAITDDFIAQTLQQTHSSPPVTNFEDSDALRGLQAVQTETRQRLRNILLLTAPPSFDDNE